MVYNISIHNQNDRDNAVSYIVNWYKLNQTIQCNNIKYTINTDPNTKIYTALNKLLSLKN